MEVDAKTLFLVLTLSSLFLAIIQLFYMATRQTYPGFKMWVIGIIILAAGYLLIFLRGSIPVSVSILAGLSAFPLSLIFLLLGTKKFLNLPAMNWKYWLSPAVCLTATAFFYLVVDLSGVRGIIMSLSVCIVGIPMSLTLWRHTNQSNRLLYLAEGGTVFLLCCTLLIRSILEMSAKLDHNIFAVDSVNIVYLLVANFLHFATVFGFIMMNNQRQEMDLKGSHQELERALAEVKQLSGFLPICSHCKNIRDDKGYWNQIESYIRDHSEAEFSHGICPECARKLYPDMDLYGDAE